jgi:hypothetical protein
MTTEQELRQALAMTRMECEWIKFALLETMRAIAPKLDKESTQDLQQRLKQGLEALDSAAAHLPGDMKRAHGALAFLRATHEALGLASE